MKEICFCGKAVLGRYSQQPSHALLFLSPPNSITFELASSQRPEAGSNFNELITD